MSFKICLIGCGRHAAQVHGPSLRHYAATTARTRLAAVCDLDRTRAEAFAREFGFGRAYSDVDEMILKEQPDAVSVVLPPQGVAAVCRTLLERGIPLLIEKPPALTAEGLRELIGWAETGGAVTQVAFNRRYTPLFVDAHRLLEEQAPPETVSQIDYDMIRWDRRDPDFSTTAIHALDAVLFLARSPYSRVRIDYQERPERGQGVANIDLTGVCRSGTRVRISFQPVAGVVLERVAVHAVNQSLLMEIPLWSAGGRLRHWKNDVLVAQRSGDEEGTGSQLFEWSGFAAENRAFFDAVRTGRRPSPCLKEAEQPVVLMEAIRNRVREVSFVGQCPDEASRLATAGRVI